jgi:hypothetical protein
MSSEVKVNKISPASGTSIVMGDSGDTLTIPSGVTLTNNGTASGFGKVLQVVQATKTDTLSQTGTTMTTIPDLQVTLTPSSTSNKVLVSWMFSVGRSNNTSIRMTLQRNGSDTPFIGDTDGSRSFVTMMLGSGGTTTQYSQNTESGSYLDSPSTTSPVTYSFQWAQTAAGHTVYLNRSVADRAAGLYEGRSVSSITAMEIAG